MGICRVRGWVHPGESGGVEVVWGCRLSRRQLADIACMHSALSCRVGFMDSQYGCSQHSWQYIGPSGNSCLFIRSMMTRACSALSFGHYVSVTHWNLLDCLLPCCKVAALCKRRSPRGRRGGREGEGVAFCNTLQ